MISHFWYSSYAHNQQTPVLRNVQLGSNHSVLTDIPLVKNLEQNVHSEQQDTLGCRAGEKLARH